jgi:hypothetical protein
MRCIVAALLLVPALAFAQTKVITTKPMTSGWLPADVASVEVRVKGRLSTDAATTARIIGRIPLKTLDISLLTQRVTILVPATQTWEVKSISIYIVPTTFTGLKPIEVETRQFAMSYLPPSGQTLAIDWGVTTGDIVFGPVTVAPAPAPAPAPSPAPAPAPSPAPTPAPAPAPGTATASPAGSCITPTGAPAADCAAPLASLVDSTGGTWKLSATQALRDGVETRAALDNFGYWPLAYILIRSTGSLCGFNPNHGFICWTAGKWQ